MNLQILFSMQRQLDERIETERGLRGERLIERKLLALLVEVGELANETRCFKFWSSKPKAADETILEEYVDGLHFILSLGLDLSFHKHIECQTCKKANRSSTNFYLYSRRFIRFG